MTHTTPDQGSFYDMANVGYGSTEVGSARRSPKR